MTTGKLSFQLVVEANFKVSKAKRKVKKGQGHGGVYIRNRIRDAIEVAIQEMEEEGIVLESSVIVPVSHESLYPR